MIAVLIRRWLSRSLWRRYGAGPGKSGHVRLAVWIVAIFVLHTAAMVAFEGMTVFDGIWLTATTVVTVGYGDLSAKTLAGRLATMLLLYLGAIFVVAKLASDWFDARAEQAYRKLHGTWDWNMRDHLLIIGTPASGNAAMPGDSGAADRAADFFARIVRQIRSNAAWADVPVQLLTNAFRTEGIPARLTDLGVVFHAGRPTTPEDLEAVHPQHARAVIVLADHENDPAGDALTFDTVDRVRRSGFTGRLVAECVDDRNRERLAGAGASAMVRPMRGYPEMLARSILAPGAEQIITDLFTAEGDECHRIDLPVPWRGIWLDLVQKLIKARIGTPLGYCDAEGKVCANPMSDGELVATALFVTVHESREHELPRVPEILGIAAAPV